MTKKTCRQKKKKKKKTKCKLKTPFAGFLIYISRKHFFNIQILFGYRFIMADLKNFLFFGKII